MVVKFTSNLVDLFKWVIQITLWKIRVESIGIPTKERETSSFSSRLEIDRSEFRGLLSRDAEELTLSGFDLQEDNGPTKKISILEINIDFVTVNPETILFDISGELRMSCNSGEYTKGGSDFECSWDREFSFGDNASGETRYSEERVGQGLLSGECFVGPIQ